ncbi:MAG TPA: Wzz/FepE/Etk N-terminal domain-containing protein [Bacteroidota bacterium]|nr:Wzz/FepE/Etk N-terminal domain-containing protein [Bacteroidota bacterium]
MKNRQRDGAKTNGHSSQVGTDRIEEINLFDYLHVIVRWKRFIAWNVGVIAVLTVIIVLILPNWYKSTATIIPPKQKSTLPSLGQLTRDLLPLASLSRLTASPDAYNYLAILKSRSAMEAVVIQFNLFEVYDIADRSMEKAVKALEDNVKFELEQEGTISIQVWDKDPQRAADMANFFAQQLNEISIRLGTQEAKNNREFIERRYLQVQVDLAAAEDSMRTFQQKYGIYALPEQTKAAVSGAADLKAQALLREVELGVLERTAGKENPITRSKALEVSEINRKLREMKYGTGEEFTQSSLDLFVPFAKVPELGLQYLRLFREVEIQNKLLEYILPLYEQAKVEEQKEVPVILVLDKAVPAERKDRPPRTIIVLSTTILAFFFSLLFLFLMETYRTRQASTNPLESKLAGLVNRVARRYKIEV